MRYSININEMLYSISISISLCTACALIQVNDQPMLSKARARAPHSLITADTRHVAEVTATMPGLNEVCTA